MSPTTYTIFFCTSPYGSQIRSQLQTRVYNSPVSANNSSQLAHTFKDRIRVGIKSVDMSDIFLRLGFP